jgi:ankyrin repeat protein
MIKHTIKNKIKNIKNENTLFHLCSKCNINELKKFIHENSSSINTIRDKNGLTPLHLAVRKLDIKIIELLLEIGSDPNLYSNYSYSTLHYLILGFKELLYLSSDNTKKFIKILDMLIKKGADINKMDSTGKSPLYMVLGLRNYKITKYFLNYNPIIDKNSLSIASQIKNKNLKDLILDLHNLQFIEYLLMVNNKSNLLREDHNMEDIIKFLF